MARQAEAWQNAIHACRIARSSADAIEAASRRGEAAMRDRIDSRYERTRERSDASAVAMSTYAASSEATSSGRPMHVSSEAPTRERC